MSTRSVNGKVRSYEGYCSECRRECEGVDLDFGVGTTEYWGSVANHHEWRHVSTCCEAEIIAYEDAEQCSKCGLHYHQMSMIEGLCPGCYRRSPEERRKDNEPEPDLLWDQLYGNQVRL